MAALFATQALAAQDASAPAPPAAHKVLHARGKTARPAAKPPQAAPPAAPAVPLAPPDPHWPANDRPKPAAITWDAQGLRIEASNASLQQILRQVSTLTGAKVEGLGGDERVYGAFGPGLARDVVSQLLQGSNYNVLMIGDQGQGAPRQIVLSARNATSMPAAPANANPDNSDDDSDVDTDDQAQPPTPPGRQNLGPGGAPHTPQQMLLEMQQRQQELQRQQQMNQQPH